MPSIKELRAENDTLRRICTDLHWMARRYADGRSSYVTSLFNWHTWTLIKLGTPLNPTDDKKVFARDGMGDKYAGLTAEAFEMERKLCQE